MSIYEEHHEKLKEILRAYAKNDVMVAFSGGVDSSLILKLTCEAARETGKKVYAVMLHTMLHPSGEVIEARKTAEEMGAIFLVLQVDELENAGIEENPVNRCYLCKKYLFQKLQEKAQELQVTEVLEGTNEDDMYVYRPGIAAVRELGIRSPLLEAGLTKREVRALAGKYQMEVSTKPSTPCLATRFPYGTALTYEAMRRVEHGEEFLKTLGFYNVRLRVHGDIARIETDKEAFGRLLEQREEIIAVLKKLGYQYITIDLEGFRSGSMDDQISEKEGRRT